MTTRALLLVPCLLATILAATPAARATDAPPKAWSIAMAETIMQRNPGTPEDRLARWSYWKGYTLLGFQMLWRSTGDRRYLDFMKREIDPFVEADGKLVNAPITSLDSIMAGAAVVALYEETHDPRYRTAAAEIRKAFDKYPRNPDGGFWHSPDLPGEMWVDGVFMGQMFLTRYGASITDREYAFDEATRQIVVFANHARKGDSGLFYHAWAANPATALVIPGRKAKWADPKTGLSCDVWSEGLGWYALILAETLAVLPPDHLRRGQVLDIYTGLAAGLKRTQDPKTGGWFQVVDKGDRPDNWIDSSGSAMFTYAIERGIDLGLLKKAEYAPVVAKGYRSILGKAKINDAGLVDLYSAGDGVCVQASYADYVNYPKSVNAKEAIAGFLWATAIVERPQLEKGRKR